MGGACSTYGGEERCMWGFGWENLRERDHLENPCIDGRIILRWIFRKWDAEVWTTLFWLRMWQALVNAVINVWVPYNGENFLTS
jgi:hypothetical protein